MNIRPYTPADYAGIAAVHNVLFPNHPETAHELTHRDATRAPDLIWGRLVAEDASQVIGVALYQQLNPWSDPHSFFAGIIVHPSWQGQGVGKALYDRMVADLTPHQPTQLRVMVREDQERAVRFFRDRGYQEKMREYESRLTISTFHPNDWTDVLRRVEAERITIRTVAELPAPLHEFYEQIEELHWRITQDIPSPAPPTRPPLDEWKKRFDRPGFLPEGNFYAFDGNHFVGTSILWRNDVNNDLQTGTTGVLREYRNRGIATALKVRALTFAKERGAHFVYTANEVGNTGMLGINMRLGFERQPGWIHFAHQIAGTR